MTIRASKPSEVDIPSDEDEDKKVVKQRNLVSSKMDEKNLKIIEDKFAGLERELTRQEQAERDKRCTHYVDYLEQNKTYSTNYRQVID